MKSDHLFALDGLRGFAALVVVVSHCAAFGFLPKFLGAGLGQMGVMLFFGLSGFLMAYLYSGKTLNRANLREYAINRATRVLPLYFIVASFVALCFITLDYSLLKVFSWKDIAGNMLLLKGSSVLWTIPVEVHFYVVFVALWFASASRNFLKSLVLLATLQLSSLIILYVNGIDYGPILFSWLHVFLFGSLIGYYYEPLKRSIENSRFSALLSVFAWLVLLLAVVAPPQLRRDFGFPTMVNYLDPITVGYPMLLFACAVFSLGPFGFFKHPILRWFGTISYSLYLLHAFVIDGATGLASRGAFPTELGFPIVLGIGTILAAASFYGFERPTQKMLRAYFSRDRQRTSFA
ncbi:acyltransferase family protein [Erythrobacter sp. GH1-10]|uniref:acyltransferase family protein n=1 Tax=Erythrobacter sp. GH1-10 TaxID=3349334 RepID=UPI003877F2E2